MTVDVHEVAPDVHLQHPAGQLPVVALAAEVLLQAVDAVVRAAPLDAGVAVADKGALQRLVRVVEVEMMHDAVAKVGGEHFALLRVGDKEALAGPRLVATFPKLVAEFRQVLIQPHLEAAEKQ